MRIDDTDHRKSDDPSTECDTCRGRGTVREFVATPNGEPVARQRGCPACHGRGVR